MGSGWPRSQPGSALGRGSAGSAAGAGAGAARRLASAPPAGIRGAGGGRGGSGGSTDEGRSGKARDIAPLRYTARIPTGTRPSHPGGSAAGAALRAAATPGLG